MQVPVLLLAPVPVTVPHLAMTMAELTKWYDDARALHQQLGLSTRLI